jgi:hypothetical protein
MDKQTAIQIRIGYSVEKSVYSRQPERGSWTEKKFGRDTDITQDILSSHY